MGHMLLLLWHCWSPSLSSTLHPAIGHNFARPASREEIISCGEVKCEKIAKRPRGIIPPLVLHLDMLTGEGQYAGFTAQITYDPTVYAQIAATAIKAWKTLPDIGTGEQLSRIVQGPTEPYSVVIDCLLQVANRTLGDMSSSLPAIKQLAYENSNKFCQEVLRPYKNRSLDDFVHLCRNVDTPPVVGQATASAPGEATGGTRSRNCFHCGKPGHLRRDCPAAKGTVDLFRRGPGICPRCHKGAHWVSGCRSKTDSQGTPIPALGNGGRGQPRAPNTPVYEAVSAPGSPIRYIPQRNASLSATLLEAPQEVQD